ncbi:MAG: hypothetical protein JW732_08915 [Dehalococcoidia bacterium]|nr:hypothetical protein [Dehalococcoidia bacterium]
MAVFSALKVKEGLNKLNARKQSGRHPHIVYEVFDDDGTFLGQTHMSHSGKDIDDNLLNLMARQLKITMSLFKGIIKCTKGRADYINVAKG